MTSVTFLIVHCNVRCNPPVSKGCSFENKAIQQPQHLAYELMVLWTKNKFSNFYLFPRTPPAYPPIRPFVDISNWERYGRERDIEPVEGIVARGSKDGVGDGEEAD